MDSGGDCTKPWRDMQRQTSFLVVAIYDCYWNTDIVSSWTTADIEDELRIDGIDSNHSHMGECVVSLDGATISP